MTPEDIALPRAMPRANPSYSKGPYPVIDREYLAITYLSDPDAIRAMVPDPLIPGGSRQMHYEWINMPDSSGFRRYQEPAWSCPAC